MLVYDTAIWCTLKVSSYCDHNLNISKYNNRTISWGTSTAVENKTPVHLLDWGFKILIVTEFLKQHYFVCFHKVVECSS